METIEILTTKIKGFGSLYKNFCSIRDSQNGRDDLTEEEVRNYQESFRQLRDAVIEIEGLRNKLDDEIHLNVAQALVHDLTLRLDTDSKGQVSFKTLNDTTKEFSTLLATVKPSFSQIAEIRLVGIGTGSTALYADICANEAENIDVAKKSVNDVRTVITETQKMAKDNTTPVKTLITDFAMKNNMSPERAVEVVKTVNEMSKKTSKILSINVSSSESSSVPVLMGNEFDRKKFNRFKGDVVDAFKAEEPLEITGQMRVAENWDSTHKFKIHDVERGKDYTINFDPATFSKVDISAHLGDEVTITRTKVGKQWFLTRLK